jgi:antitoxin (DNA-binding transcriptional repressor) of toxin-antitoxin stability system
MHIVNMLEAKSNVSRLVEAIESGIEDEIVIARNGKPTARLVAIGKTATGPRLGVAKGKFVIPENIDDTNAEISDLFSGN